MKTTFFFPILVMALFLSSCANRYIVEDFNNRTAKHQTIAVVPVVIEMTGIEYMQYDEETRIIAETDESKMFQQVLYGEILRSTKNNRKPIRVDVQTFQETLNILEKNEISIRDSWTIPSDELAEMLGVDAIVKSKVVKNRYLPDVLSMGINVARVVIDAVFDTPITSRIQRTGEIYTTVSLIDGNNPVTLWNSHRAAEIDWRDNSNAIVNNVYRHVSRKFPYRI